MISIIQDSLRKFTCTKSGYFYLGHYRAGFLQVLLETDHSGVSFYPRIDDTYSMFRLFEVFGIDPEDGKYINELEGRKCRVIFTEDRKVKRIYHATNNKIFYEVNND